MNINSPDLIDFSSRQPKAQGILFQQPDGETFVTTVVDKYPHMGDVHIEGRRVVEVSVELWISLMAEKGIYPVEPKAAATEESTNDE